MRASAAGEDEAAEGGQLHALLSALRRIHEDYFALLAAQQNASAGGSAVLRSFFSQVHGAQAWKRAS